MARISIEIGQTDIHYLRATQTPLPTSPPSRQVAISTDDTPILTPASVQIAALVDLDTPAPEPSVTNTPQDRLVNQMADRLARTLRSLFPSWSDNGLPRPFKGHEPTLYLERFGKVFREYSGVEETDKVLYFLRWCDDDLREIIDDWDDGKKDT